MKINRFALRALRQGLGLSMYAVGKAAGTTTTYVREIELGKKNPSPEMIQRLATALKVPVTAIIADPEPAARATS